MQFFGGRLGVDYTYYQSETKNQITAPRLAQSTGYILFSLNSGSVKNKGMELMITGRPIDKKDFTWDVTLNMAGNRGTLGDFVEGVDYFYVTAVQIGGVKAASIPNGGDFLALTGNRWLKLRSLSLSYDFSNLIKGQNILKNLTATFAANNLFTITNYKGGMDPEVAAVGSTGGSGSIGIEYCGVPTQRTYSFGLSLTF